MQPLLPSCYSLTPLPCTGLAQTRCSIMVGVWGRAYRLYPSCMAGYRTRKPKNAWPARSPSPLFAGEYKQIHFIDPTLPSSALNLVSAYIPKNIFPCSCIYVYIHMHVCMLRKNSPPTHTASLSQVRGHLLWNVYYRTIPTPGDRLQWQSSSVRVLLLCTHQGQLRLAIPLTP